MPVPAVCQDRGCSSASVQCLTQCSISSAASRAALYPVVRFSMLVRMAVRFFSIVMALHERFVVFVFVRLLSAYWRRPLIEALFQRLPVADPEVGVNP